MKINFILPTVDFSGGNRVIVIHAFLLQQKGREVIIISVPPKHATWRQQVRSLLKGQGWIKNQMIMPSHFDNFSVNHIVVDKSRSIIADDVPDADANANAVIATWWETAEWVHKFPKSKGVHFHFIQHHEIFDYLPKNRVEATWQLPMKKIVVAKWLDDIARKKYKNDHVKIVPHAVDPIQFSAPQRKNKPHQQYACFMHQCIVKKLI
jgi:hypothetical protein